MATITLRSTKGSPLTNAEIDGNFTNLNNAKLETNGSGANLTALNASNVSSGTLAVARGGTGQTTYTNGQLLIGNTTGNTLTKATLTAGTNIAITNGTGSISIATSATPSFTTVTTTGAATVGTDLAVNGSDITTTGTGTATIFNSNALTLNLGGAATAVNIGAATGTLTVNNATLAAKAITASTTLNVTGAATLRSTLSVTGNTTLTGDLAVNGGDITSSATTFNLLNTTVTTLNLAGAATTLTVGATTGTLTVRNTTLAAKAITASTTLGVTGATTLGNTLGVTGATTLSSTLAVTGVTTLGNTLGVTGATTLSSTLAVTGVTTLSNTLNLAAGTTSIAPLKLTSGTNLTSATAGSVEYNGKIFMATPVNTHRGIIPTEQYYRLNSNFVGSNATGAQSLFGVGVTLDSSTQYEFEYLAFMTKTAGATSNTLSLLFGGTASLNFISYTAFLQGAATALPIATAVTTWQTQGASNLATAFQVRAATTTAIRSEVILVKGVVSINTSGTFIPQYQLSAAPGGAYSTLAGSYIKIRPLGAAGVAVSVGSWA
jgi:hypothetical protein